jgi:uncharacterized protein
MTHACENDSNLFVASLSRLMYVTGYCKVLFVSMLLNTVKKIAQQHFIEARGSHAWDHTLRVCRLCESIGTAEGVDMDVLLVAAYLHDIGRWRQDQSNGALCHAQEGARMAEPILKKLPFSEGQRLNILHCIESHRFRSGQTPVTPEARVLFDADKLDAIGAVGVARAFLFAGEVGARLHSPDADIEATAPYSLDDTGYREFRVKLRKIKDRIMTPAGRKLAEARHAFMEEFFQRFLAEYKGER